MLATCLAKFAAARGCPRQTLRKSRENQACTKGRPKKDIRASKNPRTFHLATQTKVNNRSKRRKFQSFSHNFQGATIGKSGCCCCCCCCCYCCSVSCCRRLSLLSPVAAAVAFVGVLLLLQFSVVVSAVAPAGAGAGAAVVLVMMVFVLVVLLVLRLFVALNGEAKASQAFC